MAKMTRKNYEELIALLDGRIDKLTSPIPSRQILRFAEALKSAEIQDEDTDGTYSDEDYDNLLTAQELVDACLPPILESIRAHSIDPKKGWRLAKIKAGNGDNGLCAICRNPFQHFKNTVKVHCLDMHENAFHGVCRECVQNYAPLEFIEREGVEEWVKLNRSVCKKVEKDNKREGQRVNLIDAVRRHAHSTHYFGDIVKQAPDWTKGAFGEWR